MGYSLKKYSHSDLASLTKLLDSSFSISNRNKQALIKWKYFDNVLKPETITYIALFKKNVISHYTNIPITISFSQKNFKTMICTDMTTDPNHRGQGLISKLSEKVYKEVKDKKYDFSLGFSNDEGIKVDIYAKNYGYKIVGRFVRYFKIVVTPKKIDYKLVRAKNIDKSFHTPINDFFKIKKDYKYLDWRYIKKPNSEYDTYEISSGNNSLGYVVLRFLNQKCYIYDIITDINSKEHMVKVLRSIENKALEHKIRIIIYNVLDNKYWISLFNKYKYFKRVNNNINYFLTIKIHNSKLNSQKILDKENWLLMNGDIL